MMNLIYIDFAITDSCVEDSDIDFNITDSKVIWNQNARVAAKMPKKLVENTKILDRKKHLNC